MAKSSLAEYKRFIREIEARKGTAGWLKEFAKWVRDGGDRLLGFYKLTPHEFFHI